MQLAIILARGGSKRIPRKNYKLFCGKPMIYWAIKSAKDSRLFDRIEVSTDSTKILNIAQKFGIKTQIRRPQYLSDDYTDTFAVIQYEIKRILKFEKNIKYVCCLYGSSPFTEPYDLKRSFLKLKKQKLNFVFVGKSVDNRALRSFKYEKKNHLKMVFSRFMNKRTQDLPKIYCDTGQFYWGTTTSWLTKKNVFTKKTSLITSKKNSIDIDTQQDWKQAEKIFKHKK